MPSKPSSYGHEQKWQAHNSNSEFGLATVADSVGDRFMPGNGPQEPPRGNMYKPSHYSTTPMPRDLRIRMINLELKKSG